MVPGACMAIFSNMSLSWPACSGLSICILKNLPNGLVRREDVCWVFTTISVGTFMRLGNDARNNFPCRYQFPWVCWDDRILVESCYLVSSAPWDLGSRNPALTIFHWSKDASVDGWVIVLIGSFTYFNGNFPVLLLLSLNQDVEQFNLLSDTLRRHLPFGMWRSYSSIAAIPTSSHIKKFSSSKKAIGDDQAVYYNWIETVVLTSSSNWLAELLVAPCNGGVHHLFDHQINGGWLWRW